MRKANTLLSMVTIISYLCIAVPQVTYAVSLETVNNTEVFLKQSPNDVYCTLVSATNMLRRKAILNGDDNWYNIDTNSVKNIAWSSFGLYNHFSYGNYTVNSNKFQSVSYESKKETLIALLNSHPEGVVIYKTGNAPHAILITDFSDNTFYSSDPSPYYGEGRIPISKASISIDEASKYWYIAEDTTSNDEPKHLEVTQWRYRTRRKDYEYTTSNTSTLNGWELTNSHQNNETDEWSDWQSTYIQSSDTCEVEERTVEIGTSTLIYLGRYYSEEKNQFSAYPLDTTYHFEGGWFDLNEVTFLGEVFSGGRKDCHAIPGYNYYFFKVGGDQTKVISQGTETQYRYRNILTDTVYEFKREIYSEWSPWSEWSEHYVNQDDLTQVESRIITQ